MSAVGSSLDYPLGSAERISILTQILAKLPLTSAHSGMKVTVPDPPPTANVYTNTMTCVPPSKAADIRKLYFLNQRGR